MRFIIRFLTPLVLLLAMLLPAGGATAAPAVPPTPEQFEFIIGGLTFCNGETVLGQGTYSTLTKEQKDGTFVSHINLNGQGVGDQGNEYVLNWNGIAKFDDFGNFWGHGTFTSISKGSAPDEWVIFRGDSDGGVTFETVCRG